MQPNNCVLSFWPISRSLILLAGHWLMQCSQASTELSWHMVRQAQVRDIKCVIKEQEEKWEPREGNCKSKEPSGKGTENGMA